MQKSRVPGYVNKHSIPIAGEGQNIPWVIKLVGYQRLIDHGDYSDQWQCRWDALGRWDGLHNRLYRFF